MAILEAIAIPGVISALLIIFNEWLKRLADSWHKKRKFKLWETIFTQKSMGMQVSEKDEKPLYELLTEGVVEIEITIENKGNIIRVFPKGTRSQYPL